jgi:predicted nucleic acid-binding protein
VLGFPNLGAEEEAAVRALLNEFDEVPISNAVVEQTILIRRAIRIRIPDALIGASAQVTHATLVTRNISDFQQIAGLTVVHPDNV